MLTRYPKVASTLPLINFAISSTALAFQMTVLYPWHKEIDHSHAKLVDSLDGHFQKLSVVAAKQESIQRTQTPVVEDKLKNTQQTQSQQRV